MSFDRDPGPVTVEEIQSAAALLDALAHEASEQGWQILWMVLCSGADSIRDAVEFHQDEGGEAEADD